MKNGFFSLQDAHFCQRFGYYSMRNYLYGLTKQTYSIISTIDVWIQARANKSFTLVKYVTSSKRQIFSSLSLTHIPLQTHPYSIPSQTSSQIKTSTDPINLRMNPAHVEPWNNGQIFLTGPSLTLRQLRSYLSRCLIPPFIFSLEYSNKVFHDLNSSYNTKTYGKPSKVASDLLMDKGMLFYSGLLVARMPVVAGANNSIIKQLNVQTFHQQIYQLGKSYKILSKNRPNPSEKTLIRLIMQRIVFGQADRLSEMMLAFQYN